MEVVYLASRRKTELRYAELLCKTNYSFLRGASHSPELVRRAAELGIEALALNDVGGVYGIPKAFAAAKDCGPFKIISGAEVPLEGHPPVTLLALDRAGYGLMCRLLTEAHRDRPKAKPLLAFARFCAFLGEPAVRGLFALPHAPTLGDLPGDSVRPTGGMLRYDVLKDLFGDRIALPLSRFLDGRDELRTEHALETGRRYGIKTVATNDVHFHIAERAALQDTLVAIREGMPVKSAGFRLFANGERFLKSPRAMAALFVDMPEAVAESARIAERCRFSPSELRYRYPSEWIPQGHSAQSYLEAECRAGMQRRYPGGISAAVEKQVAAELKLVHELGFADYFLTVHDIVREARARGILCQGRGSAANSVVCFVLGITEIDPIRMELLFERFLSAERGEPPDIDVDFEHERREEIIQYIYEKYGRDRAAMVSAVITYRRRSSLRDVAKALGVEVGTLSARKVEKLLDDPAGGGLRGAGDPRTRELIEARCAELADFPRHLSIHSGGFTLSADPITEIVPVEPATMPGRTIVQWDKYDLDILGLLKVDVLSLGMLSAVRKTLNLVGKTAISELPADDRPTYDMIQKGDTVGTFQIESRAQMQMLPRLLPYNFYDLVVQVAIVRPGPIVGKMVHPYLKRRRGEEKADLPHPAFGPILGKTFGVPIFQEQVMKMAIVLAGFTPGEADELRRAIGAWRSSGSIDKMGQKLMQGLLKAGVPREFAERVFQQIQGFSEYGFPESHAASFALIAYASAYLKCHHPAEFLCGLVNSQPMGFYANHTLIDDAKRHGVKVLPVHPNLSEWDCTMAGKDTVRLGFRVVHGLGKAEFAALAAERARAPFRDLFDFLGRTQIRRQVVRALALGDAFACFGSDQRHALWALLAQEVLVSKSKSKIENETGRQLSLFADADASIVGSGARLFSGLNEYQAIEAEYRAFGLSARGHPMEAIRKHVKQLPKLRAAEARALANGARVEIAGLAIIMQRPPTAGGTVFATLEDETGFLDLILWKKVFERYRELILDQGFLYVRGKLQRDGHSASLLVESIRPFPFLRMREVEKLGQEVPRMLSEGVLLG